MPLLSSAPLTAAINVGPTQDGNALCRSTADISPQDAMVAVQGTQGLLNLYFQSDSGTQGAAPINQRLAENVTLTFTGKATSDIGAATLLFQALNFVEAQDAAQAYYYQAFLDLNKEEVAAAFGLIDGPNLACSVDIQLRAAAAGIVPAQLGIFRLALRMLPQVYTGNESAPTPATPPYPTVNQVQTKATSLNYSPAYTGLTGGGAANLDGLATVALPSYYALLIMTFAGASLARLEMDADPVNGAQVVVPPDHDATANPRSWRIRL